MPARRVVLAVTVLVQLVVLYAPTAPAGPEVNGLDKVVHVAVFAAVAWAAVRAGLPTWPVAAVLLAHAAVSELVQHYLLPHRDGDVRDAIADAVGVAVGLAAARLPGWVRGRRTGMMVR